MTTPARPWFNVRVKRDIHREDWPFKVVELRVCGGEPIRMTANQARRLGNGILDAVRRAEEDRDA